MRCELIVLALALSPAAARAGQGDSPTTPASEDAPPTPTPEQAPAPASEAPPVFEPPPLPPADADFSQDGKLFREVDTVPEKDREAELKAEEAAPRETEPLFHRMPVLYWVTRSAAGVFGAGTVGLLGGSIGNAINKGDDLQPLGGFHGPAIGAGVGSIAGTGLGVWGAGLLFDRQGGPQWALLGSGVGTVLGGAAATGIASGLDPSDGASAFAVGTFLAFQVGGALLFDALFGD
jgi:hypothetical protein